MPTPRREPNREGRPRTWKPGSEGDYSNRAPICDVIRIRPVEGLGLSNEKLPYPDGGGGRSSGRAPSGKEVRISESSSLEFSAGGNESAIGGLAYFGSGEILIEKRTGERRAAGLSARGWGDSTKPVRKIQSLSEYVDERTKGIRGSHQKPGLPCESRNGRFFAREPGGLVRT